MKLAETLELTLLAQGGIDVTHRHHAVISPHMRKAGGHTMPHVGREHVGHSGGGRLRSIKHPHTGRVKLNIPKRMRADSDPTDEVKMLHPKTQKVLARIRKRNKDPYAALKASQEVTGPCGCTLQLGERVTVDDVGRGKILSRKERMLTVALDNGVRRTIDQKFVHRML